MPKKRLQKKASIPIKKFVLDSIRTIEPELRKLKVKELYVFGSVVRGDTHRNSDVDVLVTFTDTVDLFVLSDLKRLLEKILGRKVDIVMREALRKEFKAQVEEEMIRAA